MSMNDPKMKIFFNEADLLLQSSKTFKDIFDLQFKTWNKNKVFININKDNKKDVVTFVEYRKQCLLYASTFISVLKDVEIGSFVALKHNNSPIWAYCFWGLLIAGYKPILINPITLKKDTDYLINQSNAKAVITDCDETYCVPTFKTSELEISSAPAKENWADEIAFCTSGTTGKSRIFVYTSENIVYQIYSAYIMPETTNDIMYNSDLRLISIIPFSHIFGFVAVFLWYTFFGRTIVFPKSNAPEDLISAIKENKVSHIYAVPLFWNKVAKTFNESLFKEKESKQQLVNKLISYNNRDISKNEAGLASFKFVNKKVQKKILGCNVRYCIAGGSTLSEETLKTINGLGYPLYNGYGMTEIGITSVELSPKVTIRNKGSVGKPLKNVEYKIENNELLVKSPQIHSYTLINGIKSPSNVDEQGYFHTGDIASIEDGQTYIKGKIKDVIIGSNGENIYPEEIELHFSNLPNVENYVILGVKRNDEEVVTLVLEITKQLNKEEIETLQNEIANRNESLPLAMQVRDFYLSTAPIPLNTSLKIKRYEVLDDLINRPETFVKLSSGEVVDFKQFDSEKVNETLSHVLDIIADVLNINKENITPKSHVIVDLGGDSFTYMSIVASIESEFNIQIKSEFIGRLNTPNEFTLYILQNQN